VKEGLIAARETETLHSTDYWFEAEMGERGSVGVGEKSKQTKVRKVWKYPRECSP